METEEPKILDRIDAFMQEHPEYHILRKDFFGKIDVDHYDYPKDAFIWLFLDHYALAKILHPILVWWKEQVDDKSFSYYLCLSFGKLGLYLGIAILALCVLAYLLAPIILAIVLKSWWFILCYLITIPFFVAVVKWTSK